MNATITNIINGKIVKTPVTVVIRVINGYPWIVEIK